MLEVITYANQVLSPNDRTVVFIGEINLLFLRYSSTSVVQSFSISKAENITETIWNSFRTNSIELVVRCSDFFLSPSEVFNAVELEEIGSIQLSQISQKARYSSTSIKRNIDTNFYMDKPLIDSITQAYPSIKIYHHATKLMDAVETGLAVYLDQNSIDILYIEKDLVLFYNQFTFHNKEESLHYLSLVLEKYRLDSKTIKIQLAGDIESNKNILDFWKKYIPQENLVYLKNSLVEHAKNWQSYITLIP